MAKKIEMTDKQLLKLSKGIRQADAAVTKVYDLLESIPLVPLNREHDEKFSDDAKLDALTYTKDYAKWVKKLKTLVVKLKDTVEQ